MLQLYFIRHGQTEWNVARRIQGHQDSNLTSKGISDAEQLAKKLEEIEWTAVYSSPSERARRTAQIIIGKKPVPTQTDKRLMEMSMGLLEGLTMAEILIKNDELHHNYWNNPSEYKNGSGEYFADVHNRVQEFIEDLLLRYESGNILILTHGIVVKMVQVIIDELEIDQLWETAFIAGTGVTKIVIDKDRMEIEIAGDVSHLK